MSSARQHLAAAAVLVWTSAACATAEPGAADSAPGRPDAGTASPDAGGADAHVVADAAPSGTPVVTMPNGGELWAQGSLQTIQWTYSGTIDRVNIELWADGAKLQDIAVDEPCDGGFEWSIPGSIPAGTQYRVRMVNADTPILWDESDADFSLYDGALTVTAPNGGESLVAGQAQAITWTSAGSVAAVDIALHAGGVQVAELATDVANTGSFSWALATTLPAATDYTIVIRDADFPSVSDESDDVFAVQNWQYVAPISIVSPIARSNFPVLVELSSTEFAYAHARADGGDLRFSSTGDRSAGFDLPYYVSEWTGGGTSRVWVRVPSLPAGSSRTIYLFYGNPATDSTSDMDAVLPNQLSSANGMTLASSYSVDLFHVQAGHTVYLPSATAVEVTARIIEVEGTIDGGGRGYSGGGIAGGVGPGAGGGSDNSGAGGAGYGGSGGLGGYDSGDTPGAAGPAYGSVNAESIQLGSGGGGPSDVDGGNGGGAITLRARDVSISGAVEVGGEAGVRGSTTGRGSGGGSGGGVLIVGHRVVVTGSLYARGGDGGTDQINTASDGGGGGGGGRIKVFYGGALTNAASIDVQGGLGGDFGDVASGVDGATGSTHIDTTASGEPIVDLGSEQPVY